VAEKIGVHRYGDPHHRGTEGTEDGRRRKGKGRIEKRKKVTEKNARETDRSNERKGSRFRQTAALTPTPPDT
jgi:hypothetical protein